MRIRFAEAHKIKLKADNLEAFELEKMRNQHQLRLSNVVEKFKAKQTSELGALRKRVQTVRLHPFLRPESSGLWLSLF